MADDIDIQIDDEMLDGFDEFDSFDNPDDDTNSRDPIQDVVTGAMDQLTDASTMGKITRTIAEHALPSGFKVITDEADELGKDIGGMYGEVEKNLSKSLLEVKRLINNSIRSASFVPENIRERIFEATTVDEEDKIKDRLKDNLSDVERSIQQSDNDIFNDISTRLLESSNQGLALDGETAKMATEQSAKLLNEMRQINAYNSNVQSPFQRKSLELQFRQYYAIKELVESNRASSADSITHLQAIMRNTSLPDIKKTLLSEEYTQGVVDRFTGGVGESIYDYTSKFRGRVKDNVTDKLNNFLEAVTTGANSVSDIGGTFDGLDPSLRNELLGGELAEGGASWLSKIAGSRLGKLSENNPKLLEASNKLLYWKENFPSLLNGWLESSKSDNWILNQIDDIIPAMPNNDIKLTGDLTGEGVKGLTDTGVGAGGMDRVSYNTHNNVIPGYLARILQQVTIANTQNPDEELVTYGLKSREFETASVADSRARESLFNNQNRQRNFDSIFATLDKDESLTGEGRQELAERVLKDSFDGKTFSLSELTNTTFNDDLLNALLERLSNISDLDRSDIDLALAREQMRLSDGVRDDAVKLNKLDQLGQRDVLDGLGYTDVGLDGTTTLNNELFRRDIVSSVNLSKKYRDGNGQVIPGSIAKRTEPTKGKATVSKFNSEGKLITTEEGKSTDKVALSDAVKQVKGLYDSIRNRGTDEPNAEPLDIDDRSSVGSLKAVISATAKDVKAKGQQVGDSFKSAAVRVKDNVAETSSNVKEDIKDNRYVKEIDAAVLRAKDRLIEQDFDAIDFKKAMAELAELAVDAKRKVSDGLEGLKVPNFEIPGYVAGLDTGTLSPDERAVKEQRFEEVTAPLGDNSRGEVINDSMLSGIRDILNIFGKEQLTNFNLSFMEDSTDGVRAMPVLIKDGDTEVTNLRELIDVNTSGFESLLSGLDVINTTIANSATGEVNEGNGKGFLLNSVSTLFNGASNLTSSYFKGVSKLTGALAGGVGTIAGKFGKGLGSMRSAKSDIYVSGSNKPALRASGLISGEYTDTNTGNIIRNKDDITGEVKDSLGNVVITEEEFAEGLFALDTGKSGGRSVLKLITTPIKGAFKLQSAVIGAAVKVPVFVIGKINSLWRRPYDVYVAGEDNPRLIAHLFKNGGYRSRNTGKLIKHPDDIDGEVEDLNGNILLTNDDIMKGIFTRGGRRIGDSKLFNLVKSSIAMPLKVAKGMVGLSFKLAKAPLDIAKAGISAATGFFGDKPKEVIAGDMGVAENLLEAIYGHMVTVWPANYDNDGADASAFDEAMLAKQQEIVDAIKSGEPGFNPSNSDSDGDGDRDGGWRDILSRRNGKEAESVKEETREGEGKEKKDNIFTEMFALLGKFLPMIGSGIVALGTALVGGDVVKKLMGNSGVDIDAPDIDRDGKDKGKGKDPKRKSVKGRGKLARVGKIAKNAFSALKGPAAKQGAKMVGKTVAKKALVKGALVGAGAIAAGTGAVVGGIALAPLIAIAGVAYTAFEIGAFFYDRRDTEQLERLRFLQYGVDDDYGIISDLRELESELEDHVVLGSKPTLKIPVKEVVEEHAEMFGVDLDNPTQVNNFTTWFVNRFVPVYLTHNQVLNNLDSSADLDDVDDDLDEEHIVQYVKRTVNTAKHLDAAYDITATPSPGDTILANKQQIKDYAKQLIEENGGKVNSNKQPPVSSQISKAVKETTEVKEVPTPVVATDVAIKRSPEPSLRRPSVTNTLAIGKRMVSHELPAKGSPSERGSGVFIETSKLGDVYTSEAGAVIKRYFDQELGRTIELLHDDGSISSYSGLSSFDKDAKLGKQVSKAMKLGLAGKVNGKDGVQWNMKVPSASGAYRTLSPKDVISDGNIVEDKVVLSDATNVDITQVKNFNEVTANGIATKPTRTSSSASKELTAKLKVDKKRSKDLADTLSTVTQEQSRKLQDSQRESLDAIQTAFEQRNAMIENQGSMLTSLSSIFDAIVANGDSKVDLKKVKHPTPARAVAVPVSLKKRSQF